MRPPMLTIWVEKMFVESIYEGKYKRSKVSILQMANQQGEFVNLKLHIHFHNSVKNFKGVKNFFSYHLCILLWVPWITYHILWIVCFLGNIWHLTFCGLGFSYDLQFQTLQRMRNRKMQKQLTNTRTNIKWFIDLYRI